MGDDSYSLDEVTEDKTTDTADNKADDKPAEPKDDESQAKEAPSFKDIVNDTVNKMVKTDSGSWELPEDVAKDLDESVLFAVQTERRYRDTQSSYTKSQQKLKALSTANEELVNHLIESTTLNLTDEQRTELDDLRTSNPEAWRAKLNEHEEAAKKAQQAKIDEFNKKGDAASQEEMRRMAYNDFTERTGIELSDNVLETQVPAGFQKNLQNGTWTFDEFLTKVEEFLSPKKVKDADKASKDDNPKDMSKLTGGSKPSEHAQNKAAAVSYDKEIY
tara:strand:+ start:1343 stop:2167 length:825 start_codon:yes stop_codon:yes gene_type:complete